MERLLPFAASLSLAAWGLLAFEPAAGRGPDPLLLATSPAAGPSDFVRFIEEGRGEGRLETAVAAYVNPLGARVELIAAVNVADGAYYAGLQELFAGYDALLYELVKPEGADLSALARSNSLLSLFQRGLKEVLDLEFQLEAVDYTPENFVHADLDPETFRALQREKGENLLTLLLKAMGAAWKLETQGRGSQLNAFSLLAAFASADRARSLKYLLARELKNVEALLAGFESEDGEEVSVILGERNKRAIRVLREELARGKRNLGLFYGAGHMLDLERRLTRELGFRKVAEEWRVAWLIRK